MSSIDKDAIIELLENGPHRSLVGGKQLTLAFGGIYIASTTLSAKPLLVWETEKSSYGRYFVPVESLHHDIQSRISAPAANGNDNVNANGHNNTPVKLEIIDSVKAKGKDAEALIERLTIGSRTTDWVRFTKGPSAGYIRFEPKEMDQWFENGALFAGIKNPFKRIDTKPIASHVVVKIDGVEVAESNVAVILNETGLKDAFYLPATSIINWGMVEKSDWRTACPYKGEAWYLNLTVNGKKHENAVWYYMYPTHESSGVEGFVSFYNKDNVEILVDGVKAMELEDNTTRSTGTPTVLSIMPSDHSLEYKWDRR